MSNDFDEELFDKFFSFLNRRLIYRSMNSVSQFYITKSDKSTDDVDPTDFLFFECLEEIIITKKWSRYGLEGVMNEPIQCILINNKGDRSCEFESAFIIIYAREQPRGEFKFLICKVENDVWSFPGGKKMFPSESFENCITREVREELYGFSISSIESSIGLGPLFSFGGSSVFVHEVEWGKTGEIVNNLIKNYQSLKKENQLFDFDTEKTSKFIKEDEEYLDNLLEISKKFKFVEEIVDYQFISADEIEKMQGGRSFFLKQLHNSFQKNIVRRSMQTSKRSKKFKQ
ncbi:predicted protein [Naegleria gruberi]|uniref:Predicted protein n=1 Tax=Naegleria gruberi TaxID=5762 RepID=D2UXW1_NAEGR|nr:uncharacterized protein NAEGRDRAFT_61260 [Naegleria gruberi]EFC50359.1 predicted protein [Naegleria gruberi]|eukprot:XP_002683103.1 predicted protein [Naegleria gruberi strain NEG-M]